MKTLVTLLKIAMLATTLSFVMSCNQNNKRNSNVNTNPYYNNGMYTYSANGQCVNNQNGQVVAQTYCQQFNGGYGTQQCNGNSSLFVFIRGNQYACSTDQTAYQTFYQYGGCWVSCANSMGISCSGQIAYQGGSSNQSQGMQCL